MHPSQHRNQAEKCLTNAEEDAGLTDIETQNEILKAIAHALLAQVEL